MVGASDALCLHHVGKLVISDKLVDGMFGASHDQLAAAVLVGANDVLCLHHIGKLVISDKLVDGMFGASHDQLAVTVWLAPVTYFVCITLASW
jgi:hypothetical protein